MDIQLIETNQNSSRHDIRCIIITKGVYRELVSERRHERSSDSIEIVARIGWFQMLKGYIPNEWTGLHGKRPSIEEYVRKEDYVYRRAVDEETYRVLMEWTNSNSTLWKDRCAA
jgi:hypothetical protein